MITRTTIAAALLLVSASLLGGCVYEQAPPPAYGPAYAYAPGYAYAPAYYPQSSVSLGFAFGGHDGGHHHHHWH